MVMEARSVEGASGGRPELGCDGVREPDVLAESTRGEVGAVCDTIARPPLRREADFNSSLAERSMLALSSLRRLAVTVSLLVADLSGATAAVLGDLADSWRSCCCCCGDREANALSWDTGRDRRARVSSLDVGVQHWAGDMEGEKERDMLRIQLDGASDEASSEELSRPDGTQHMPASTGGASVAQLCNAKVVCEL